MTTRTPEPVVPAVRVVRKGHVDLYAYHCPWCRTAHTHGAVGGPLTGRAPHCHAPRSPIKDGYKLLEVGTVSSFRSVPKMDRATFVEVSNFLTEAFAAAARARRRPLRRVLAPARKPTMGSSRAPRSTAH